MIQCNRNISLDVLLEGLFDYAGMFPPAHRTFQEALRESGSFAQSLQRPWLLATDLVLDIEHARKLPSENLAAAGFHRDISVCLLATEPPPQVLSVARTLRLGGTPKIGFRIASIEAKATPDEIDALLTHYGSYTDSLHAVLVLEPDLSTQTWRHTLRSTIATLATSPHRVALKCRTTGPSGIGPATLAAAIAGAADAGIGCKVTGGLHHPIVEPSRHEYPMGFLNVAAAVMLRRVLGATASEELLTALLTNRSMSELRCLEGIHFRELHITHAQLEAAKAQAPFSIGSCSLHEPDADLTRLCG